MASGLLLGLARGHAGDLGGDYVILQPPTLEGGGAPFGGTARITPHRNSLAVSWQLETGKRLRGLALADGGDLLGVSLSTGGRAYGVAIYRREGDRWRGRWLTSIDGGSAVGEISFSGGPGGELTGQHPFTSLRPGAGSFAGNVAITRKGEDFLLTFTAGSLVIYRGLGTVRDGRLVVAWSFGSTPALAVYGVGGGGALAGRRVALRSGQPVGNVEQLVRASDAPELTLPPAQPLLDAEPAPAGAPESVAEAAPGRDELPTVSDPENAAANAAAANIALMAGTAAAPAVKTLTYPDLMSRYGERGQAARWLEQQLNAGERELLDAALERMRAPGADGALAGKTIGELIEEQRKLVEGR